MIGNQMFIEDVKISVLEKNFFGEEIFFIQQLHM